MKKRLFFILVFAFIFTSFMESAFAAEDSDYVQVARERLYVGGLEESDLKVQQQLLSVDENGNRAGGAAGVEARRDESEEGF